MIVNQPTTLQTLSSANATHPSIEWSRRKTLSEYSFAGRMFKYASAIRSLIKSC